MSTFRELKLGNSDETLGPEELPYAREVGRRLRAIRHQHGWALHDVADRSHGEFKASVVGAYERGERVISVERLLRVAQLYKVPSAELLPRPKGDVAASTSNPAPAPDCTIDLVRLHALDDADATVLERYAATIQLLRQDFNDKVLTIRHHARRPGHGHRMQRRRTQKPTGGARLAELASA